MEERRSIPVSHFRGRESRRLQRVHILTELKGICLKIGHMQSSAEGRLACREVARLLDAVLARETRPQPGRRR